MDNEREFKEKIKMYSKNTNTTFLKLLKTCLTHSAYVQTPELCLLMSKQPMSTSAHKKDHNSTLFKCKFIQRKQNRIFSSYVRGKDRYHDGKIFAWFQQSNTLTVTLLSAQITLHTHPFRTQSSKREKPHTYTLSLSA